MNGADAIANNLNSQNLSKKEISTVTGPYVFGFLAHF